MNYHSVPSLQHLTAAGIAIAICNNYKIKELLEQKRNLNSGKSRRLTRTVGNTSCWSVFETSANHEHRNREYPILQNDVSNDTLQQVQDTVNGMISPLNLAPSFQKIILSFVSHVVLELEKWKEDHHEVLPDARVYFFWKGVGTIDRESTAEKLLNDEELSVKYRFLLACMYCDEEHLFSLWDRLHDSYKAHVISKCHSRSLLNYWTNLLDGLHSRRSILPDAIYITNVSALHYFYNRCDSEEKKQAFLNDVMIKQGKNSDIVNFCVSKLHQN